MLTRFEISFLLSSRFKKSSVLDKLLKFIYTHLYRHEKSPSLGVIVHGCKPVACEYIILTSMRYLEVEGYVMSRRKNGTHYYLLTDKGYARLSAEIKKYTGEQQAEGAKA